MARSKKTKMMREVEAELGQKLEDYLPLELTELDQTEVAEKLGLSKATLGYWLLKLNIRIERVALGPNDSLKVTRG